MAVFSLVGTLRDGSSPEPPEIAALTPQRIEWPRGEDGEITLTVYDAAGEPADLTGCTLALSVRPRNVSGGDATISRQGVLVDAVNGTALVLLVGADTVDLADRSTYRYDVWLTDLDGGRHQIIPESAFFLSPTVTEPDDVPSAAPIAPLTDTFLFSPTAAELQAAIDAGTLLGTPSRPYVVACTGTSSLSTRVSLKSNVRIVGPCTFTTTLAPLAGAVDDVTNGLFFTPLTFHGTTTALGADASDGAHQFEVGDASFVDLVNTALLAGRTFVQIEGALNLLASVDSNRLAIEIHEVASASGTTVVVKDVLRFSRSSADDGLYGTPVVKLVTAIAENVGLEDVTLDVYGTNTAVGVLLDGVQGASIKHVRGKGFSRTVFEVINGALDVRVDDYRSLGGNNTNLHFVDSHRFSVLNCSYDGRGDWLHPLGNPRAWLAIDNNCTQFEVRGGVIGRHAMGIRNWGGRDALIDLSVEDCDGTKWVGRTGGDEDYNAYGVAYGSGAAGVGLGAHASYGQGLHLRLRCKNIRTKASGPGVFIHDYQYISGGSIHLINQRLNTTTDVDGNPVHYNGIMFSDNEGTSHFQDIVVSGYTSYGVAFENGGGGGNWTVDNLSISSVTGGVSVGTDPAIVYGGSDTGSKHVINRFLIGDCGTPIHVGNLVPWHHEYRDVVHGNDWSYGIAAKAHATMHIARRTIGGVPASPGALCEFVTPAAGERAVKTTGLSAGFVNKAIYGVGVTGDAGNLCMVAPLADYGVIGARTDQNVEIGDHLVHDGTTGLVIVDNASTSGYLVADSQYVAGVGSNTVMYKQPSTAALAVSADVDLAADYAWTGAHDYTGGTIEVATPISGQQPATKDYADALVGGINPKDNLAVIKNDHLGVLGPVSANGVEQVHWNFMKGAADGWTVAAGTTSTDGSRSGGIRKIVTAAVANDVQAQYLIDPLMFSVPPNDTGGNAWALSYRFKITGAIEAGMQAYVGLGQTPEALILVGIQGATSTTKYVVQPLNTITPPVTLSADANITIGAFVQLDLYFDKVHLFARVGGTGGTWRQVAVAADVYASYAYLVWYLKNGSTAAARPMELDLVVLSVEAQ